ncbi:hypothetical protein [Streptomyces sp. NPDC059076]|uniref:hypothetical protein n=1 Tax=unclassified Streptomyces TaxID=2593676 RepID=UPI0036B7B953
MTLYFDPVAILGNDRDAFRGRWEDRLWLNVPGPSYGRETDTCWTGRLSAPAHVLYGGKHLSEYVYRQPKTLRTRPNANRGGRQRPFPRVRL